MSPQLITLPSPTSIEEALSKLPDRELALAWGQQSLSPKTIEAMVLLASKLSEHYRYAIGLSVEMCQYLYDNPAGGTAGMDRFLRCEQVGTLVGHYDGYEVHVIQEVPDPDLEEEYMMLLVLDDLRMVDSYLLTRLRIYTDHVASSHLKVLEKGRSNE